MHDIPRMSASLALILDNNQLLLGRKIRKGATIGEGTLNGPGGKCEDGQLARENLTQEVYDEVGLTVLAAREVAVIEFHNGTKNIMTVWVFLATRWRGTPRSSVEMCEPEQGWWFDVNRLPFDEMLASDRLWMPRVLSGEHLFGVVHQSDDAKIVHHAEFHSNKR